MGCSSCGKSKAASASARQAAQRSGAGMPAGFSIENPVLIGDPDSTLVQVRVLKQYKHLRIQQKAWVSGSGVQILIDSGAFYDITNVAQRARLWMVAGMPQKYLTEDEAQAVANATGGVVVEVA